jgi:hypothetical protein
MKGNEIKLAFEVCRCVLGECRQLSVGWVLNRAVSRSGLWFFFNASFLRRMNRIDQFFLNLLYYCTVVFLFTVSNRPCFFVILFYPEKGAKMEANCVPVCPLFANYDCLL